MDEEHPTYNIHLHHESDTQESGVLTARVPALLLRRQCNAMVRPYISVTRETAYTETTGL